MSRERLTVHSAFAGNSKNKTFFALHGKLYALPRLHNQAFGAHSAVAACFWRENLMRRIACAGKETTDMNVGLTVAEVIDNKKLQIIAFGKIIGTVNAIFSNIEQVSRMQIIARFCAVIFAKQLAAFTVQD